jgi:hypothetical protein
MKKLLLILLCLPMIGFGQNVNIPDANFKVYLKNNFYNTQAFTSPQFQWQLDSTVTPSFLSNPVTSYKYDMQGKLIEEVTMFTAPLDYPDSVGNTFYTIEGFKYIYEWDATNNPKSLTIFNINGAALDSMIYFEFIYNPNNQITERTQFKTNFSVWFDSMLGNAQETGGWIKSYYSYNASNENILVESYEWDGFSYSIPIGKREYTYQSGNLVLEVSYSYNITYWDTNFVTYNTWSNGNEIMKITESYNGGFTNTDTVIFNYNSIPSSITATPFIQNANQIIDRNDNQGNISTYYYSSFINSTGTSDISKNENKELLKVTDLLGRETKQTNQPLFYIYDDGTVEKRIVIE